MLVLGIETSTMQGGVALLGAEGLVAEYTLSVAATHSERLLPALDRVLQDAGVTLEGVDGIAVSLGPGSFTGLRIGVSTAKGLAYATGIPLVGVPTLEAMAWALPSARWQLCPVLDARKHEVYAALFQHERDGLRRVSDDQALAPEALCALIRKPTLLFGDGLAAYRETFGHLLGEHLLIPPVANRGGRAACVAELGRQRLLAGERADLASLTPAYLRPSEAELRRRPAAR
jgi:tRNA threonylcarbamoyladenosine biosynthesis protein TsaB